MAASALTQKCISAPVQAMMPITVFAVGVMLGTEKYQHTYAANMVLVAIGVAAASYGANPACLFCVQTAACVCATFLLC